MNNRAQVSVEYMAILGFVILLSIPLTMMFFSQTQDTIGTINSAQAQRSSRQIIDEAESIGYQGPPSFTTIKVKMPSDVESVIISNNELTFKLKIGVYTTDIVTISNVNLSGYISNASGLQTIRIVAIGNSVNISTI